MFNLPWELWLLHDELGWRPLSASTGLGLAVDQSEEITTGFMLFFNRLRYEGFLERIIVGSLYCQDELDSKYMMQ